MMRPDDNYEVIRHPICNVTPCVAVCGGHGARLRRDSETRSTNAPTSVAGGQIHILAATHINYSMLFRKPVDIQANN